MKILKIVLLNALRVSSKSSQKMTAALLQIASAAEAVRVARGTTAVMKKATTARSMQRVLRLI